MNPNGHLVGIWGCTRIYSGIALDGLLDEQPASRQTALFRNERNASSRWIEIDDLREAKRRTWNCLLILHQLSPTIPLYWRNHMRYFFFTLWCGSPFAWTFAFDPVYFKLLWSTRKPMRAVNVRIIYGKRLLVERKSLHHQVDFHQSSSTDALRHLSGPQMCIIPKTDQDPG